MIYHRPQGLACWSSLQTQVLQNFWLVFRCYFITGQLPVIILQLWVVFNGKFLQEFHVNARVPQGFIHCPALFLININNLPHDFICYIVICVDYITHFSNCDLASDFSAVARAGF